MRLCVFHLVSVLACGASSALAQESKGVPRVLLDRQLHERAVLLAGLDGRTIMYTDAAGLLRNESVAEYLAIIPPLEPAAPARPPAPANGHREPELPPARAWSVIDLADGERFFGDVAPAAAAKDSIRWSHPVLGQMEFKIDQVRRIRLDMPPAGSWSKPVPVLAPDTKDDLVIFANGDRLSGFVEGLTGLPRELRLTSSEKGAGAGGARTIKLDVVREVVFANPPQSIPARSTLVWLKDGSVIACRAVKSGRLGELTLNLSLQDSEASPSDVTADPRPAGALRLDDLQGAAFEPGALVPLCSLPPVEQKPVGDRRWTRPIAIADADRAVLGAGDIELPGPLSVEWDLPPGATHLGADAELPRQMWTWGDCQVVVSALGSGSGASAETELFRSRLNADQPHARIAVAVAGAKRLRIRIEPGAFGPVQNRVVLRRPLLLIERK